MIPSHSRMEWRRLRLVRTIIESLKTHIMSKQPFISYQQSPADNQRIKSVNSPPPRPNTTHILI